MILNSNIPGGPLQEKWEKRCFENKLVNPSNRRKYTVIVVGTGLAGASAAASLAEMGYNVLAFTILDSPRRAHSIAAQGGINAAKNYPNDGDSVWRLFYDTIKGGDYRSREANVYRLAQISSSIIDQCVAQGVPFAREYGGELANRSFGGAQLSRTFYSRGQTGQQLLLGAYGALMRQVAEGGVKMFTRHEMLDLVMIDGRARGIVARNCVSGEVIRYAAHAVVLATGGYGRVFNLSTNAYNSNATAVWRCHKRGALFANPCFTQIHPTCIPYAGDYQSKLTLMSESLRNDGRVWVPRNKADAKKRANDIPEKDRWYFLEERYPSFGNLVPRDVASRAAKHVCDAGHGAGPSGYAVYLDFRDAIARDGRETIEAKYGNLFDLYHHIVDDNPYESPMTIYPAVHYTMGGLWVDYNLMSTIPGLFVAGEANFSDHGANRLGASALMQGLADGYFIIPYSLGHYLAEIGPSALDRDAAEYVQTERETRAALQRLIEAGAKGSTTAQEFHVELGKIMWDHVGMSRNEAGLKRAIAEIRALRERFWSDLRLPKLSGFNKMLEHAGRVADYLELGELMAVDALHRRESCGGHYREESVDAEEEARRDDEQFAHVAAWEWKGENAESELHHEHLEFENVMLTQRSYK
jgi:succinate dehydrogenase / fumarate reductase flavoprotein subunit